jgi:hypothetical protein
MAVSEITLGMYRAALHHRECKERVSEVLCTSFRSTTTRSLVYVFSGFVA